MRAFFPTALASSGGLETLQVVVRPGIPGKPFFFFYFQPVFQTQKRDGTNHKLSLKNQNISGTCLTHLLHHFFFIFFFAVFFQQNFRLFSKKKKKKVSEGSTLK